LRIKLLIDRDNTLKCPLKRGEKETKMRGKPSETNELSFARTELHKGYFANGELIFLIEPSFFFLCALIALRRSSCVNFLLFDDIFTRLIPTTNQLQLTIYRLSLGLAQNAYRTLYNVSRNESRNNNSESQSRERNCHIVTSHRTHHTHTPHTHIHHTHTHSRTHLSLL